MIERRAQPRPWKYRVVALALALSALAHAALFLGMPRRLAAVEVEAPEYLATLLPPPAAAALPAEMTAPVVVPDALGASVPKAARAPRLAPAPELASLAPPLPEGFPDGSGPQEAVLPSEISRELIAMEEPPQVASADTFAPLPAVAPDPFPSEALPATLSIDYQLTSAFADGRATYRWEREGDHYRIRGEAQAEGFFTLFLEGRILQESSGTVTENGLRPDRFVEEKPNREREGLEFDWPARRVTFSRGGDRNTTVLADDTVDWLSMIFQLAHVPPKGSSSMALQVFTQRRMYRYRLDVLGVEEIDIPLGKVRALHLRHSGAENKEAVDVWLGVDHHYLPLKMRFPVARNRLMVEQVATQVSSGR